MMDRLFSIIAKTKIKRFAAELLITVIVLNQGITALAWTGGPISGPKRIKSEAGCLHNCWTDEECQDILKELFDEEPEVFEEIAKQMEKYGWDADTHGPSTDTGHEATGPAASASDAEKEKPETATPSDAEEEETGTATPSEAEKEETGIATPSEAEKEEAGAATPSDAEEEESKKATPSEAKKKHSRYYKITEDGRLRLKDCEHHHDETCGYYAWKSVYQYKDDEVLVKAVMVSGKEEALPGGSVLVVERVEDPEAIRTIAEKVERETGQVYDCSQSYDIRFECEGTEVEPEDAAVQVEIKYKEAIPTGEAEETLPPEASEEPVKILHLTDDDKVQDVTGEISRNILGDVRAATFETESFSIFVLTRPLPNGTEFRYEDNEKIITANVSEEAGIPQNATLEVEVIEGDDERYAAAKAELEALVRKQATGGTEGEEDGEGNTGRLAQEIAGTELLLYNFRFLDFFDEEIPVDENVQIDLNIEYREPKNLINNGVSAMSEEEKNSMPDGSNDAEMISAYQINDGSSIQKLSSSYNGKASCLAGISFAAEGVGTFGVMAASSYPVSTETYIDPDNHPERTYALGYILQNFNVFVEEDALINHIVGAVAIGKDVTFFGQRSIGGTSGSGAPNYALTTNSYLGGDVKFYEGWDNIISGYDPQGTSSLLFVKDDDIIAKCGKSVRAVKNPDYLNMSFAFEAISAQAKLLSDSANDLGDRNGKLTISKSGVYKISDLNKITQVEVTVDPNDPKGNVIIVSDQDSAAILPQVTIKGMDLTKPDEYKKDGMGIVFILPNTKKVDIKSRTYGKAVGHLVAPNALVIGVNPNSVWDKIGDFNGCIIAKNLEVPSEGHMFPYKGDLLETGIQFKLGKRINDKIPADTEKFTFILETMTENQGKYISGREIETVSNTNGDVNFKPIVYNKAGTYYYRVYEEQPKNQTDNNYVYDENSYYIKVEVEESRDALDTLLGWELESITYWKVGADGKRIGDEVSVDIPSGNSLKTVIDLTQDTAAPAIFYNKTSDQVTLPETGGSGTNKYPFIGFWLFMTSILGMIYSVRKRETEIDRQ